MNSKIETMIQKADARLNTRAGWESNDIRSYFRDLMERGAVEVGYRESCGKTDPTIFIHREWVKIVKNLRLTGVAITEERIPHSNAWATLAGGFWNSIKYTIDDKVQQGGALRPTTTP